MIEEFVEGQEHSVEYIYFHEKHYFFALTLKCTTKPPNFIETGNSELAIVGKDILDKIKLVVEHALNSLKFTEGASHTEIKNSNNGDINIIEIGGRMVGDCIGSNLVHYSTGIDFVKVVIYVSCGIQPTLSSDSYPQPAKIVYIITEDDKKEFERIALEDQIE